VVDIGFHYVAVDGNGNPMSTTEFVSFAWLS
jgi:hypothetical protein